jgi:hypothetical protein
MDWQKDTAHGCRSASFFCQRMFLPSAWDFTAIKAATLEQPFA